MTDDSVCLHMDKIMVMAVYAYIHKYIYKYEHIDTHTFCSNKTLHSALVGP